MFNLQEVLSPLSIGDYPKRVLIVLHGAIGDVVRALPLAVRIKQGWPECELSWAVEPKSVGILEGHPAIDRLLVFNRGGGLGEFRRFLREVRELRADLVIDLQRHCKSGVVSFSSRAKRRVGFNWRNAKEFNWLFNNEWIGYHSDSLPKIEHYQRFGDWLGLPKLEPLDFGLIFPEDLVSRAESLLRDECDTRGWPLPEPSRRVALLIGGSWESKRPSPQQFAEIARRIVTEFSALPILLGGPADREAAEQVLRIIPETECISLAGRTSLRELAYLLSQVGSAVSGDSGPMHIAAAVGTPVVSLWGPTSPMRTGPWGSERWMVRSYIGCSPCYRRKCPGLNSLCLRGIPVDVVIHRLREIQS